MQKSIRIHPPKLPIENFNSGLTLRSRPLASPAHKGGVRLSTHASDM